MSRIPPDSNSVPSKNGPLTPSTEDEAKALEALKRLLLREERSEVVQLRQELDEAKVTPERLAQLLPRTVQTANLEGPHLAKALSPTLADAFDKQVHENPQKLVDVISPIMGPAIRQSIRQTIQSMFHSVNQVVEHSLSWRGLQWRMESWRTGLPFAQVVLMRTLIYRVEEVYLIHRKNGLLLAHVADPTVGPTDAKTVSGMLTAIEDFVRDSFRPGQDHTMDTIQFQDEKRHRSMTCWIECGPKAVLAAVITGHPPHSVRDCMQDTLQRIHRDFGSELDTFRGDNTSFGHASGYLEMSATPLAATDPYLSECLMTETRPAESKNVLVRALVFAVPVVALLALFSWLAWMGWRYHQRSQVAALIEPPATVTLSIEGSELFARGSAHHEWLVAADEKLQASQIVKSWDMSQVKNIDEPWRMYLERLSQTPGIEVIHTERQSNQYRLRGLRDPLAADPHALFEGTGLEPERVESQWKPFVSADLEIIQARALARLEPPPTVQLEFNGRELTARGTAPQAWIDRLHLYVTMESGITRAVTHELLAVETAELAPLIAQCQAISFQFAAQSAELPPEQVAKYDQLLPLIRRLTELASLLDRELRIDLVGYVDSREVPRQDRVTLSESRAKNVWRGLVRRGIPGNIFVTRGAGSQIVEGSETGTDAANRTVRIGVRLGTWDVSSPP
jgi:outer membrane protein OmpA-like peptidoglycan-associated protein